MPGRPRESERQPTIVGINLKKLRGEKPQSVLAEISGVSQGFISAIEAFRLRNPSADKLQLIADALGADVMDFFRGEVAPPDGEDFEQATQRTFDEFLKSHLAKGITAWEVDQLRRAHWPWGPPTIHAWHHALNALRDIVAAKEDEK